jgi:hypothetical protein
MFSLLSPAYSTFLLLDSAVVVSRINPKLPVNFDRLRLVDWVLTIVLGSEVVVVSSLMTLTRDGMKIKLEELRGFLFFRRYQIPVLPSLSADSH